MKLVIVAYGRPAPQGSKRGGQHAGQMIEQSAYLPAWRVAVANAASRAATAAGYRPASRPVFPGTVRVSIIFYVGTDQCRIEGDPASTGGKPDIDKLTRSTLDALKIAQIYKDDSYVIHLVCEKRRPAPGVGTGAYIEVEIYA